MGDMSNFFKVWISIFISLSYCYAITNLVSKGIKRLIVLVPIICLFFMVPLKISSIIVRGCIGFIISWLGSSKLLLLAFDKGPLALDPSITFLKFLLISCLPIEISKNPSNSPNNRKQTQKWNLSLPIKITLLASVIALSYYLTNIGNKNQNQKINTNQITTLVLYSLYIYLFLEVFIALTTALARATLAIQLEPFFNQPYFATSLQDFWGQRWNLMVSRILRATVYKPSLVLWAGLFGPIWAQIIAVLSTFFVSGLFHELLFYYMLRVRPTWEVTCYFVLHGFCLTAEILVKRALGESDTWRFLRVVYGPLTVGFVMLTSFLLFFPPLIRNNADERCIQEYVYLGLFFRDFVVRIWPF